MKSVLFMLIILLCISSEATALGRLFMTADQRIQLEQKTPAKKDKKNEEVINQQIEPQALYLNGFVKPKHAASTIWVNGLVRHAKPQKSYFVRHWVSPGNQISVDLKGMRAEMSPGQTLDIDNHVIKEVYHSNIQANDQNEGLVNNVTLDSTEKKPEENNPSSLMEQAETINQRVTNLPE